jgi:citrate lyase subunit beta/citryl-CoA lyase
MATRRVHRSGLTMPVVTKRFVDNAWRRGCDYINLDLEDSVPPHLKAYARSLIKEAIPNVSKGGAEVYTRINHDYVLADLEAIVWPGLSRVNYPKAEYGSEILRLDAIITRLERERGIRPGTVEIGANIETAVGVAHGYEIASASPRVKDFGGASGYDMSRDLGVEMFVGFDQFIYGKGELELTARALGIEVRGAPFVANTTGSVSDGEHAFRQAEAARKCGFRLGGGLNPAGSWLAAVRPGARSMAASSTAMRPPGRVIRWSGLSYVPNTTVQKPRRSPVCKRPCRKHLHNLVEIGQSCLFGARI